MYSFYVSKEYKSQNPRCIERIQTQNPKCIERIHKKSPAALFESKSELDTDVVGAAGDNFELLEYRKHFYNVKSIENSVRMMKLS